MTKEELYKLVENWDTLEYAKELTRVGSPNDPKELNNRKLKEGQHRNILDKLQFLIDHFFCKYELNPKRDFMNIFLTWIEQFEGFINDADNEFFSDLKAENRFAFLLTSKIIFFNRDQILCLIDFIWNEIKKELLTMVLNQNNIEINELQSCGQLIENQLNASVFVPLSDSSHFMEFRHKMPAGFYNKITIPCIDRLLLPIELKSCKYLEKIRNEYKNKNNIFIIEDFSGSGTTAKTKLRNIIEKYNFKHIYFCPFIIYDKAIKELNDLSDIAQKRNKTFKLIYGTMFNEMYSISEEGNDSFFTDEIKLALRIISKKYFNSHFKENGYLYKDYKKSNPKEPTSFGFKNCGLTLVLYSNCPNNSLPIIWGDNKGWNPLFHRHERYKKVLK